MGYIAQSCIPAAIAPMPMASLPFITTIGTSDFTVGTSIRKSQLFRAHVYPNSKSLAFRS